MPGSSPAKVKVVNIPQVGIVCKDVENTVSAFWNILGVGPWSIFECGSSEMSDLKYRGKPTSGRFKVAIAHMEPVGIELIEPLEGESIFTDRLEEIGEGLHHINIVAAGMDAKTIEKEMAHQGFPSIQSGQFGADPGDYFSYFDMRLPLKTIVKAGDWPARAFEGAGRFPEDSSAESPAEIKIPGMKQIGIAVRDVYETALNYWYLFAVGPWEIREWGNFMLYDRKYYGELSWGREKLGHAYPGDMELELLQGVIGPSVYSDWADAAGEYEGAIHHLKFLCDDVDGVSERFRKQGFQSVQSGHFGVPGENEGGFNYIDIPPIHCIMEPVQKPKILPIEPSAHVP